MKLPALQAPYTIRKIESTDASGSSQIKMARPVQGGCFSAHVDEVRASGVTMVPGFCVAGGAGALVFRMSLNERVVSIEAKASEGSTDESGELDFRVWVDAEQCAINHEFPAVVARTALEALGLHELATVRG